MDIKLQKKGIDIEIKAVFEDHNKIRDIISQKGAKLIGVFDMEDIYFNVPHGRLKARAGDIKDILIQYNRENISTPKKSEFLVSVIQKDSNIIPSLSKALGVKVIVRKKREIWILDNIRFHIDNVEELGKFIEIEARGESDDDLPKLKKQIKEFLDLFNIEEDNFIKGSYSDLILQNQR
ncbi:class IV adenylate cyclase [Candidatus Parcubacteria bacterium]|nr:class IV adenylate cyclase [Candidatus Parcubacteria bacterium]